MYRKRRKRLHKRRRSTVVGAFAALLIVVVGVPALASANGVDNLVGKVVGSGGSAGGATGGSSGGGGGSVAPKAGVPPTYTPPLHGTAPHGQGTVGVVDLQPSNTNPYAGDPSTNPPGTGEEVIVGQSRGEQGANGYNGKVTLLYLFGNPIVQVTSTPGQSNDGPLQPLQTQLLDQVCQGSGGQLCLTLLGMHSSSTGNSSTNSFQGVGADIGGDSGLHVSVLSSNGNISDDGSCQTAHGDSSAASVAAGEQPVVDALQGDSTSTACSSGAQSVDQHSTVLSLGGNGLPIPAAGCDNGTPNTNFVSLAPLLAAVCNASDVNGSQTSAPYGVREALAVFALISGDSSLIKVTGGAAESHAVAPPGGTTTPPATGTQGTKGAGGKGGNGNGNGNGNGAGGGAGNGGAANQAAAGNGSLAFTGADLLALGLIGGALILGGLALTTMAGRSHRQTV